MASASSEGFKCSICLEFYSGSSFKDYFVSTPGGHVFHFSCIKKLIEAGHTCCPMCREHLTLSTLTRLYGIDPSPRPGRSSESGNKITPQYNKISENCDADEARPDYVFKIVLLGNSSVGKSSLLNRFTTGEFKGDLVATTGCDLCFRVVLMGGKSVKLTIWDTVGQEKFRSVATNCVRNAHGVMLVYDVTDMHSFSKIEEWIQFVDDHAPTDAGKLLIGNKVDVKEEERMVSQRHGKALATKLGLSFFETSAKSANNVEAAFRCLVGEIMEKTVLNPNSDNYEGGDENENGTWSPSSSVSRSRSRLRLPSLHTYEDDADYSPYSSRQNASCC